MGKIKKTFIKVNLYIIAFFVLLMLIFSKGEGNGVMLFIFGSAIIYTIMWTVFYVFIIGTIVDIFKSIKR